MNSVVWPLAALAWLIALIFDLYVAYLWGREVLEGVRRRSLEAGPVLWFSACLLAAVYLLASGVRLSAS